jgi:hypothetical protein
MAEFEQFREPSVPEDAFVWHLPEEGDDSAAWTNLH